MLSAAVLLAVGFSALLFDLRSRWAIIACVLVPGAWELARLVDRKFDAPPLAWVAGVCVLGFCLPYFPGVTLSTPWLWAMALSALTLYILLGFRYLPIAVMAPWILMNGFVCAYLGLWSARLFELTRPQLGWSGIGPLAFTILCIATADTAAYAAGRLLGKHKLCPTISGKKTVEGAAGGLLATVLVAWLLAHPLIGFGGAKACLLGGVLAAVSVIGDLFISGIKRYAGAKDTSHLIPGHGGIMDRFDALTFAAPIAWFLIRWLAAA